MAADRRGLCPRCARSFAIAGTWRSPYVRHHLLPRSQRTPDNETCPGSGLPPAEKAYIGIANYTPEVIRALRKDE